MFYKVTPSLVTLLQSLAQLEKIPDVDAPHVRKWIISAWKRWSMEYIGKLQNAAWKGWLTHFSSVSHFYTPWNRQKTKSFLTFSGGIEMWRWTKSTCDESIAKIYFVFFTILHMKFLGTRNFPHALQTLRRIVRSDTSLLQVHKTHNS